MTTRTLSFNYACHFLTRSRVRMATRVYASTLLAVLLLGIIFLPGAGKEGVPEWLLLLGRFHPVVLHIPVGLLFLLPVLHVIAWGSPKDSLRPAIAAVLLLSAGSAVAASMCGLFLSQESAYGGETLSRHRMLSLIFSACVVMLMLLESERAHSSESRASFSKVALYAYRALFPVTLLCLTVGAHLGASLSHGETFLTEHLPTSIKVSLGMQKPKSAQTGTPLSAYESVVAPILKSRCTNCHGRDKVKGGLRLDTAESILAGGDTQRDDHKPLLVPGNPAQSPLIQSLLLPPDDDAHMPPSGKAQPTAAEIESLRQWVQAGAPGLSRL